MDSNNSVSTTSTQTSNELALIHNDPVLNARQKIILEGMYTIAIKHDTTIDELKNKICPFYQKGSHPSCRGCEQDDLTVRQCANDFSELIVHRPMMQWRAEFGLIRRAENMVSIKDVPGLGMRCDDCFIAEKCAMRLPASECRIDWDIPEDVVESPKSILQELLKIQLKRIQRASRFEEIEGGVPDQTLSAEMDRLAALTTQYNEVDAIKFKRTDEVSIPRGATSGGGGILEKIFGGKKQEELPAAESVTVDGESVVLSPSDAPPIPQPKETVKVLKKSARKNA